MYIHMHMCTHVHMHIYIQVHIHIHTYMHSCMHTCIHTYTHTYIYHPSVSRTKFYVFYWEGKDHDGIDFSSLKSCRSRLRSLGRCFRVSGLQGSSFRVWGLACTMCCTNFVDSRVEAWHWWEFG